LKLRVMTKRTLTNFRGFDEPVEIFQAGRHTDSAGRTREWTEEELDEIVRNHNDATAAPIVIGHPKTNDPAYGWTGSLFRAGKSLMATFKKVEQQFADLVEQGRYAKRSVSIGRGPDGLRLLHVGFLGGAAPALDLAPMSYAQPESVDQVFEFSAEVDWQTPSLLSRALRRMREFLLEQFGADTADRVLPSYDLDFLDEHAKDLRNRPLEGESDPQPIRGAFNRAVQPTAAGGHTEMPFSQADIDRARAEERAQAEAEFNRQREQLDSELATARAERHRAEFSAELERLQADGRLTPAQVPGALEFMLSLAAAPAEFEFAAEGQSNSRVDRLAWFRDFVKALPQQVRVGPRADDDPGTPQRSSFAAPTGASVNADRLSIHERALQYARQHNTTYLAAVRAVEQQEA
jgi:hypothetical protein